MNNTTVSASSGFSLAIAAPLMFAILQILIPVLPQLGVGEPIGDQSDTVRSLVTPAGWAFSIWGPLYAGSILFAVYQALPSQRDNGLLMQIRWPAASAFLGNAVWALYTQSFGLSVISALIILFTLISLLIIMRRFVFWSAPLTSGERWCAVLPLSALASWLTAASIVNIAATLKFHGVEGGDATPIIAAAIIVVGGVIAAAALIRIQGNPPFALVFLWALAAIYSSGGTEASEVALATGIAALLVIVTTIVGLRSGGTTRWFGVRSSAPHLSI